MHELRKYINIITESEAQADGIETRIGGQIGEGSRRAVYAHADDPDLVIKEQMEMHNEQNRREWNYWNDLKDTQFARWFAPCLSMTEDSRYLVQKRTQPLAAEPDRLPVILLFFDAWNYGNLASNIGILDGRPVSHDYGLSFAPIDLILQDSERMAEMLAYSDFETASHRIYFDDGFPNGYYHEDNIEWICDIVDSRLVD